MADGAAIAQIARTKSNNNPSEGCAYCDRPGLPILPLRFAYHFGTPAKQGDDKSNRVVQRWNGGESVLRVMQDGFLYLFDERDGGTWRYFAVTSDGYFREYPVDQAPPSKVTFSCSRKGDQIKASVINIRKPKEAKTVWMAYSSVLWTREIRNKYKSDLDLRARRMDSLSIPELLAGNLPKNAFRIDSVGALLAQSSAEYSGQHGVYGTSVTKGINRQDDAVELGQRMHAVMPGKGLAVCLSDPIGEAQEIRHYANLANAELDRVNKKYARELTVSRAFEQLEKGFNDGGKLSEWSEKYASGIDRQKLANFRTKFASETRGLISLRDSRCADYLQGVQNDRFKAARDEDFSRTDVPSCLSFVRQFADVLHGVGLNDAERGFAETSLSKIDDDNIWFRVLAGNQKSLLDFAFEEKTKDVFGNFKKLYSAVDKWEKLYKDVAKELKLAAGTAVTSSLAAGSTAAGTDRFFRGTLSVGEAVKHTIFNMQGLITKTAQAPVLRIGALAGWLWFHTVPIPLMQEITGAAASRRAKEALWTLELERRLIQSVNTAGTKRWQMNVADISDELGDGGNVKVRFIVFDWSFHLQQTQRGLTLTATQTFEQGVAELRARNVIVSAVGGVIEPNLASLPRANEGTNFWKSAIKTARSGPASAGLAAVAGLFQVVAFCDVAKQPATGKRTVKMLAAGIGFLGAMGEATAASMTIWKEIGHAAPKGGVGVWALGNTKVFAAYGGMLSGIASMIGGAVTVSDGIGLKGEGDIDAGNWTIAAGSLLVVAGAAGTVGGGLGLYAAGTTLLGLGPVGWAVLAIGAVALGIYFLFRASEATDDDLEAWIKKSCLGTAQNIYADQGEEDRRFGELFKLPINVDMEWRKGIAGGNFDIGISVPLMPNCWLQYELTVTLEDGKVLKAHESRSLSMAGLTLPSIELFRSYESLNAPLYDARADGVRWHLSYMALQAEPIKASVLLKYWPNRVKNPDIVLPHANGMVFEIKA